MADRFDKFTDGAKKTLSYAQQEAQRFSHNYIGTEHLLLGLIRDEHEVAARVLQESGVSLSKARSTVEAIIGRGDPLVMAEVGLTPRAKKVIELAVDEARRLNHHYVGTEHLLLGLIREGQGIGAGVLESFGVSLDRTRERLLSAIQESSSPAQFSGGGVIQRPPEWASTQSRVQVTAFGPGASSDRPSLRELLRVIPVAQSLTVEGTTITLLSLEIYSDGFLVNLRLIPEASDPFQRFPMIRIEASDDRGRTYQRLPGGGTGSVGLWRLVEIFSPALDRETTRIRLDVVELRWRAGRDVANDHVQSGRWTFDVPLIGASD